MHTFVYGTLTHPDRAEAVLDEFEYRGAARLSGLHPVEGEYPTLAPGGHTEGRLLWTRDPAALDRYEGVGSGLYVRVSVPLAGDGRDADCPAEAAVYVGDPARLDAPAEWPGTGPFAERVRDYCRTRDVSIERI